MGVLTDESALDAGPIADDTPPDASLPDVPSAIDTPRTTDTPLATDAPRATDTPTATDTPSATDAPRATDVPADVATVDAPACPSGSSLCAAACVDLARDPSHCGACGQRCPASPNAAAACNAGRCGVTCAAGFGDCNGVASDGCEVELATSTTHCGACGRACSAGQSCAAGVCSSPVWEGFESGRWPWAPWTFAGGGSTDWAATAACAHDGARGLAGPSIGSRWYYRTDRTFGAAGERISAWVRATSAGRAYLGFGASAAGGWSFGFAPNTRQVVFFRHAAWGFAQIAASAATFSADTWYRAELTFGAGGAVTGRVYSEAGATVVTLATTIAELPTGGVALYGFNACVDTIELR